VSIATPKRRHLRGYAFDPQLSTELASAEINETIFDLPWERELAPGPCGEYVDVVDYDPASGGYYQPIDLNDSSLLAQNGLAPSEGHPMFHQQMVYAVAMTTIERFERALGRRILWSPRMKGADDSHYVGRLRIYPHALRQQNAYYDPDRKALLFGYFQAADSDPGRIYPGGIVFTCLSQDVIAHETTHAILDGLHRSLLSASNADSLAFHEAFADLVALLQHFSMPAVLRHQIARTHADLRSENLLAELAVQFGQATGQYGALRDAIGAYDAKSGTWQRSQADPAALLKTSEPHDRGAILVAAVFDAFLMVYERRTADLLRIATGGSGILPAGALHPDLVARLADEAAKAAGHMLAICIRAIDYCPPVSLTFGDFLRAMITADTEIVPDDPLGYRIAIVEAFRVRGIYPKDLRTLAPDTLCWTKPGADVQKLLQPTLLSLRPFADAFAYLDHPAAADPRQEIFTKLRDWRVGLHTILKTFFNTRSPAHRQRLGAEMGLDLAKGRGGIEVRSLYFARKVTPIGSGVPRAIMSMVQRRTIPAHRATPEFVFQGGCTIIVDLRSGEIEYLIRKNILSDRRLAEESQYHRSERAGLTGLYFGRMELSRKLANLHAADRELEGR
jgi:hypothetical protein